MFECYPVARFSEGNSGIEAIATCPAASKGEPWYRRDNPQFDLARCSQMAEAVFHEHAMDRLRGVWIQRREAENAHMIGRSRALPRKPALPVNGATQHQGEVGMTRGPR